MLTDIENGTMTDSEFCIEAAKKALAYQVSKGKSYYSYFFGNVARLVNGQLSDIYGVIGYALSGFMVYNSTIRYNVRTPDASGINWVATKILNESHLSNQQVNSDAYIPTSGLVYSMNQTIINTNDALAKFTEK